MQQVDTEPKTMPIAVPSAERSTFSSRAKDRARRDRALAGQELREAWRLERNLVRQTLDTPADDESARLGRNETAHFIATLCTFGLWGPVWIYVLVRNNYRYGRTEHGRMLRRHQADERARVAGEQRSRRREHERAIRAEGVEEWRRLGRKLTGRTDR